MVLWINGFRVHRTVCNLTRLNTPLRTAVPSLIQ